MMKNKDQAIDYITQAAGSSNKNYSSPLNLDITRTLEGQSQEGIIDETCFENYNNLRKAIRTGGVWLAVWTIIIAINGNLPWAITLAIVCLMAFYFSDVAAMFLVYAGLMLWAAALNIFISGDSVWAFTGMVQVVLSLISINEYRKYHKTKREYNSAIVQQEPSSLLYRENHLAWLALLLGSFILVGLVGFIPAFVAVDYVNTTGFEDLVITVLLAIIELGILGLPIGIAALASGSRPKAAAAVGIGLGTLSVLVQFGLVILGSAL